MSANNDYSEKLRRLQAKTLAHYHSANPTMKEQGAPARCFDSSSYLTRTLGQMSFTIKPSGGFVIEDPCCDVSENICIPPGEVSNIFLIDLSGSFPSPYTNAILVSWDPVPNATSYTVSFSNTYTTVLIEYTGGTSATIYSEGYPYAETVTITAYNSCGESIGTGDTIPCFLAGSLVALADGTFKAIEEIEIGDLVIGAFGEINEVLFLHRPLLGNKKMLNINNEHHTTSHHPHVGLNKQFYCLDPHLLDTQIYGREVDVITEAGFGRIFLHGLNPGRTQMLVEGIELKTVEGSRIVNTLETYYLPPETQLYNLAVSGSHTYHVDGYAVTGFPNENDFDYNTWTKRA